MQKKVLKMNPADAEIAEEPVNRREAIAGAEADKGSGKTVRCSRQFAPSAVRRPQSPLNRAEIDRYIVGIVSGTGETDTKQVRLIIIKRSAYRPLFICLLS